MFEEVTSKMLSRCCNVEVDFGPLAITFGVEVGYVCSKCKRILKQNEIIYYKTSQILDGVFEPVDKKTQKFLENY